jgi:type VI secretion system protein ImpA
MALDLSMVEPWLQPLPDAEEPCGKDLEYDLEFLELMRVAEGKAETQFSAAEPPNWRDVREQSEALMARTRDLRIAMLWLRAAVNLTGFSAAAPGLHLLHGLLTNFPDHVHPMPDPSDGDEYARANVLATMPKSDGLLGDLRQCLLFKLRGTGEVRLRSFAVAAGQMPANADETPYTQGQVKQILASAVEQEPDFRDLPGQVLAEIKALAAVMDQRFGAGTAAELKPLSALVKVLDDALPQAAPTDSPDGTDDASAADGATAPARGPTAALGSVRSREDALRAIDMVCDYLEHHEPTNPAQLLLRRARRIINHNFLQLIKELAPDALNEAARVMGIDPESLNSEPAGGENANESY